MRTITVESNRRYDKTIRKYNILKEYDRYYLCECIFEDKPIYRECFLKIDIDGIKSMRKTGGPKPGGYK